MRYVALLLGTVALPGTLLSVAQNAAALSSSAARDSAQATIAAVDSKAATAANAGRVRFVPPSITERIAAGELLLRTKDYEGATDELNKVIEISQQQAVSEESKVDGIYLLAEAYFRSEQFLSARRYYRQIIERAPARPYDGYAGRALSRLVDIALRTDTLDSLEFVFARIDKLGTSDASGSLQYARGKAFFAKKDYAAARAAVGALPGTSEFAHQAQYLLGVIRTREAVEAAIANAPPAEGAGAESAPAAAPPAPSAAASFDPAIEQFRKVTRMPGTTSEQRHVVDLAWMAIGRLFHERDQYLEAAEAYSHVDRSSPEFSTMLYELAWVYVRLGDFQRAQRALEVLAITDPKSLELADSSLLRADLMLRSGQFDKALALYQEVREEYDPVRGQVQTFLETTTDPAVYYDRLTEDEMPEGAVALPPVVIEWARDEAKDERVFAVIDDVTRSRKLIKRSRRVASKLNAVLNGPTRVKAFPQLKAGLEQVVGLINQLSMARLTLAEGMDDEAGSVSGRLASVRDERRRLMKRLRYMPDSDEDFAAREASGERQWNEVSQKLQVLTLEADRLQAIVNALRKVLVDAEKFNVSVDAASRERFSMEIEANERDLATYRQRIQQFRDAIEMGRAQIGFGDQRYVEDDKVRARFRELFAEEVSLVASGQDEGGAREYARNIQPLLSRADTIESRLANRRSELESEAMAAADKMLRVVSTEASNIESGADRLDSLDQQARLLVGEVAMRNFGLVRDRLKSVVLRADVGIVQQAWELREEQMRRVRNLQRERAREEQNLNDELQEVLDDAEDTE
ncbi:MAG TPA: tetratricopeptide repeat protein [Polyangiaceae bacterium]|nr:tetratricopeptide repeat protein [Polyangiaceae bacterium]